eukprot:gene3680-6494_t
MCLEPEITLQPPVFPAFNMFPKINETMETTTCPKLENMMYQQQRKEEDLTNSYFQQYSAMKPIEKRPMVYRKPLEIPNFIKPLSKPERKMKPQTGHWTSEEHKAFLLGYQECGRQWTKIAKDYVKTRTAIQVTSHAQQYIRE